MHEKVRKFTNGKANADHMSFLTFKDWNQSVKEDVDYLKSSPLIKDCPVSGYVLNIDNGVLTRVA